ncbi:MAG: phosphoglucomutase/phosphomannomutase family protein, partial [Anaerolineaceae bacterium]
MTKIKFGTDGWRARIAEDYTFDNVRRCAQGFATFLKENGRADQGVVIGYDQRFQADNFAASTAEVMAANNIHVWLTESNTPTPAISYAVVERQAGGAVNITASHNAATDCGFKVRDPLGGAIPPSDLKRIEGMIPENSKVPRIKLDDALSD